MGANAATPHQVEGRNGGGRGVEVNRQRLVIRGGKRAVLWVFSPWAVLRGIITFLSLSGAVD